MWRRGAAACVLALALLVPSPGRAKNLPSYDLVSLAYLSTDIVVASITEVPGASDKRLIATVESVLYGSALKPGDRLDTLTPFLEAFYPLAGCRAILFLNSEPRKYAFPFENMNTPFSVVPDGALLIDAYGHVHRSKQLMDPGGYTAEGWPGIVVGLPGFKREPTREDDLKLPSLDAERADLATALAEVAPVRNLLNGLAEPGDMPALLHLIDRTSNDERDCPLRMANAITERAEQQVFTLNNPEYLLAAFVKSGGYFPAAKYFFDLRTQQCCQVDFEAQIARVRMLTTVLLDHSRDLATREGAAKVLKAYYTYYRSLPPDALLAAEAVFRNSREDPHLRSRALEL